MVTFHSTNGFNPKQSHDVLNHPVQSAESTKPRPQALPETGEMMNHHPSVHNHFLKHGDEAYSSN